MEEIRVNPEVQEMLDRVAKIIRTSKDQIVVVDKTIEESNDRVAESKKIVEIEREER